jgi:DNA sulfur modification protein DndD
MIIKSIRLANFQCYYDSENLFEFSEGLNLIIGDNTAGKSKLYDAFYWVVYDRLPSYKNQKTESVKEKFINELAKSKALDKKPIKVEVELTFKDNRGYEYQFVRSYHVWRDGYEWKGDVSSKEKAYRYDVLSFKPFEDVESVKRLIMNEAFKPYMWFQGEQVEDILDFERPETLKRAIEVLSGVKQFEDISKIAEIALKIAKEALETQLRRTTKTRGETEKISGEIEALRSKIKSRSESLSKNQSELHKAEKRRDELRAFEQDSKDLQRINVQIENIGKKIVKKQTEIETQSYNMTKNLFNRFWLLANAKPLHEAFEQKFERYRVKREDRKIEQQVEERVQESIAFRSRLPFDVPDEKYLKEMLNENICFLCNRPFEKDSDVHQHIQQHLNHPDKKTVKPSQNKQAYHNFYNDLRSLDKLGQDKAKSPEVVRDEIGLHIRILREFEQERDDLQEELNELNKQRNDILSNLPHSSESSVLSAAQEIQRVERDIKESGHNLGRLEKEIELIEKDLADKEKYLDELATKNLSSPKYSLAVQVLTDLFEVTDRTKQRIFQELVERLQSEANKHYETMTINNQGFKGRIKLEQVGRNNDEYIPKIVSSDGIEITALNQANLTLVKLSVIMAIISGRSNTADLYPLISDAPTSNFTENYTIGFCKRVSEVYRQSIVMNKEFYLNESLRDRLFDEVKSLGKVYIIESRAEDGMREDLTATNTQIKLIKA